jgi:hypothetical protein
VKMGGFGERMMVGRVRTRLSPLSLVKFEGSPWVSAWLRRSIWPVRAASKKRLARAIASGGRPAGECDKLESSRASPLDATFGDVESMIGSSGSRILSKAYNGLDRDLALPYTIRHI